MDGGGTWRDPPSWMGEIGTRVPVGLAGSEWRRAEASGRGRGPFSGRAMIMARGLGARNVRRVPCLQPAGQYVPRPSFLLRGGRESPRALGGPQAGPAGAADG